MKRSILMHSLLLAVMLCPFVAASVIFRDPAGVGLDMTIDQAGNVYFAGAPSSDPNSAYRDVTVKYDNNGSKLWEQAYRGPVNGAGWCDGIAVDQRGNAYVTGHTFIRQRVNWSDDTVFGYMTVKYDPNGKQLWKGIYTEAQRVLMSADRIAVDNAGNVYVAAESDLPDTRSDPNDPNKVEYIADWEPDSDIVIIKYDTNGKQQWLARHRISGKMSAFPSAITVDTGRNVCVTGWSMPRTTGPGYPPRDVPSALKRSQIVTLKYDANGKELWVATYKEPEKGVSSRDLIIGTEGNIYVIGENALVIKYDAHGNQQWARWFKNAAELAKFLGSLKR
jgi:outer membrane protein assembly factor BamB